MLLGNPAGSAQEEAKPRQEEPRPEANRQEEAKPAPQNNNDVKHKGKQEEVKPPKDEKPSKQDKQQESKAPRDETREQQHAEDARQQDRPADRARPAGNSARIPDDQFRQHFGRQHTVVINRPVIVEGQPRFQYGGYWFVISDPWPPDWAYTDDCYIDYLDGDYFLFDLLHPGVRVALFVAM
jgi:hypothetical protein